MTHADRYSFVAAGVFVFRIIPCLDLNVFKELWQALSAANSVHVLI